VLLRLQRLPGGQPSLIPWWRCVADHPPVLRLEAVCKTYNAGTAAEVEVLHDIDLVLNRGEFVALMGPSGSGKSTLLNIIGLLDRPNSGKLYINDQDTGLLADEALTKLRGHSIGFVFQSHFLISAFTALENVIMPMLVDQKFPNAAMRERAHSLLAEMELDKWENNLANNMSGGQQQRVAIARGLAMNPSMILADEPTGNLDTVSTDTVFKMMRKVNVDDGTTFLIVTHNLDLAKRCDRILEVVDGRMVGQTKRLANAVS
jgi:lipoprotein-releasing system ATP-binding protein